MRPIPILAFSILSLLTHPGLAADIEDDPIYQIGDAACTRVLDDDGFETYADKVGGDPSTFCACVGSQFVEKQELQTFVMDMAASEEEVAEVFVEILTENMNACLGFGGEGEDYVDGDLVGIEGYEENVADGYQDGPNWSEMPDQANCEFAIDGLLEPTNFDRAHINDWISDSGVGAEDLCSCAATIMEDHADEYATEFEATRDPDLYFSYMSRSLDQCQTAIWQR